MWKGTESDTKNKSYEDIIDLPHHQSTTRPHMSLYDRAAQFSPFAALTGYEDAVRETARLTDDRVELSEEKQTEIRESLNWLRAHLEEHPEISITYFAPDEKKEGGAYVTERGRIKKMDEYQRMIMMENQIRIEMDKIVEITIFFFANS